MKIGRNDPCHCGSGEKYKKCHLLKEEAARAAEVASAPIAAAPAADADPAARRMDKRNQPKAPPAPQKASSPATPIRRRAP